MFILDLYSNVLSARFKNKRGMLCMHVLIIGLINKIPIVVVFTTFVQCLFFQGIGFFSHALVLRNTWPIRSSL